MTVTIPDRGAPDLAALPPLVVAGRLGRLRAALAERDLAGVPLLVTHLTNIRWLTGFTGSAARLLVLDDHAVFVTDGRYADQAPAELAAAGLGADDVTVVVGTSHAVQAGLLRRHAGAASRVGLEAEHLSWAEALDLGDGPFAGAEVVAVRGLVTQLRTVKDAAELARIEAAAALVDAGLDALLPRLWDGPSEEGWARELGRWLVDHGAEGWSFPPIVASGPNSALPHHRAGARRITDGDLVTIDVGCLVEGYCSDMTRTVVVGEPHPEQRALWEVVHLAQAAGVAAVAPGVSAAAPDAACRDVISVAGWGGSFRHGTGHGVGLDIHEVPFLGASATATLAVDNVVTVEPGVYRPGAGGVRIEDLLHVTPGGARPLSCAPKDLVCPRSPRTT
jgi:Xaa-Pro aminopeptidase